MAKETIRKFVAIAGSAGSLEWVLKIIAALPAQSGCCFLVLIHRKTDHQSILQEVIASRTRLPVREAEDKEQLLPDHIYLAPADYHFLLEGKNHCALDVSEKIHFSRPSIDVSLDSIAETYGADSIAVLLSGANADGAYGMKKIREHKGATIVQSPQTAEFPYMPAEAIKSCRDHKVIDGDHIPDALVQLLGC